MKKVKVGDDSKMSFWNDCWLLNKPLCQQFQALHFHSLHKLASVAQTSLCCTDSSNGAKRILGACLSSAADQQLVQLETLLATQTPTDQ